LLPSLYLPPPWSVNLRVLNYLVEKYVHSNCLLLTSTQYFIFFHSALLCFFVSAFSFSPFVSTKLPLRLRSFTNLQEFGSMLLFNIFVCRVLDHGQLRQNNECTWDDWFLYWTYFYNGELCFSLIGMAIWQAILI